MLTGSDSRFEQLIEAMTQLSMGRTDVRVPIGMDGDAWDALATGINLLGEELRNKELKLAQAEGTLQDTVDLYEHAPIWFCSVDVTTLAVLDCNSTMADAWGATKREILERKFIDFFPDSEQKSLGELLQRAARSGTPTEGHLRLTLTDGIEKNVSLDVSTTRAATGESLRYRVAMRDNTQIVQLERQLHASQKMEAVGQLAAGVAHDFNNLLTIILGASDILRAELAGTSDAIHTLDELVTAANAAADLTRRLVAFGRRGVAYTEELSCVSAIERATSMLLRLITENIQVEVLTAPRLWDVDMVPGDLEQVLVNLALNAQAAMPDGGRLTIEARNGHDPDIGEVVQVSVRDTGHGMSSEVAARAFEPFFTTKPRGSGTGLGLATCYGIVNRAKGRMSLDSRSGEGTRVQIILPRAPSKDRDSLSGHPSNAKAISILLVEDEVGVRKIASRFLERQGFEVEQSSTGEDALRILDMRKHFDAIVSDVVMPGMGGVELAVHVRARDPDASLLLVSGYAPDIPESLLADELIDFLPKPYTPSQLISRLEQLLAKKTASSDSA